MISKIPVLLALLVLANSSILFAQTPPLVKQPDLAKAGGESQFYVKIYGGYGLLTPGSYKPVSSNGNLYSESSVGLGSGLHYGVGVGYIINDFLNVGIDADYLSGHKITTSSQTHSGSMFSASSNTLMHSVFSIIPNVTFKALSKPTYFIYNRLGIIMAVKTKVSDPARDTSSNVNSSAQPVSSAQSVMIQNDYKFGLGLGLQVAVGIQFVLTQKLRGFGEIVGSYLPVTASSFTTVQTTSSYGNNNVLNKPTPSNPNPVTATSTTIFSESGNYNQSEPSSFGKVNINYIGLNAGIVYRF